LIPDGAGAVGGDQLLMTLEREDIGGVLDKSEDDNSVDEEMSEEDFRKIVDTTNAQLPAMDEYPTTPIRKAIPPGSLLSDEARPPSPTSITDFPYFEPWVGEDKNIHVPVRASTVSLLPRVLARVEDVSDAMESMNLEKESFDGRVQPVHQVTTYNVVAGLGTYGRTMVLNRVDKGGMADTGANCSMTANWKALRNVKQLEKSIFVGVAVTDDGNIRQTAECTHIGDYPIECDDGSVIFTKCFYNPNASDTIISPQAIIDASAEFHTWEQIGRRMGQPGQLRFIGHSTTRTITLHQNNGLYFCNSQVFDVKDENECWNNRVDPEMDVGMHKCETNRTSRKPGKSQQYTPTSKAKILESETWYLRLGGCSEQQLADLPKHATGLPAKFEWHPFRFVDFREFARVHKQPVGRDPSRVSRRAARFYFDFGFMRASNDDFTKPSVHSDRVVESFDGYTSYLMIVDEVTKYSWIFPTKSKEPPVELTKQFLREFGNATGGMIRCDQGGELARSEEWRTMVFKDFAYKVEPTGADSPEQNGQVERYNQTLATIVRTLLYGAHLPAKYWSAAAIHAIYLMNRRVHSAISMTPYEA
jgi:hypothetical protein